MAIDWQIYGHERALSALEADISADGSGFVHAYLLSGPAGVGKFAVARRIAQLAQCEGEGADSEAGLVVCGECHVCREIERGTHGDTIICRDEGHSLKIEEVRKIIDAVSMSRQANYKVVVLENIERMTLEAANALLKTLEAPPQRTLFVLTTSRVHDILETIISRVRLIRFDRVSKAAFDQFFTEKLPDAPADIRFFTEGLPGLAMELVEDADRLESLLNMKRQIADLLAENDVSKRISYVGDISAKAKELKNEQPIQDFLWVFQLVAREKMVEMNDSRLTKALHRSVETHKLLKRNVHKRMLLESLMLTL